MLSSVAVPRSSALTKPKLYLGANCRDVCLSADGMRGDRVLQGQIADAMIVGGRGEVAAGIR